MWLSRRRRLPCAFKRPTKVFEDAIAGGRNALIALHGALPLEGGLPLVTGNQIDWRYRGEWREIHRGWSDRKGGLRLAGRV